MRERGSKRGLLVILIIIIIVVTILPYSWKNYLRMTVVRLFSPLMKRVNSTTIKLKDTTSSLVHLRRLKEENSSLLQEMDKMKSDVVGLDELKLENQRLRGLLGLKDTYQQYKKVAANVIGRDSTNWFKSLIIDKGFNDGVRRKDPVVTAAGIVGMVYENGRYKSKVILLNDSSFRIGVIVQRTRDIGVVEGESEDLLSLSFIPRTSDIREGDVLISSGIGSIYPKGLKVGEIIKVYEKDFKLYKTADVKPAVDFGRLEELVVMAKTGSGEIMSKGEEDAPEETEILPDKKEEEEPEKAGPAQPEEAKTQPKTQPLPEPQKPKPASAAEQPKPQAQTPVAPAPKPLPQETPKVAEPPKPQPSPSVVPKAEVVKPAPPEQVLKPAPVVPGGQSSPLQTVPLAPVQKAEPVKPETQKKEETSR